MQWIVGAEIRYLPLNPYNEGLMPYITNLYSELLERLTWVETTIKYLLGFELKMTILQASWWKNLRGQRI